MSTQQHESTTIDIQLDEWLTIGQAAEYSGRTEDAIRYLVRAKKVDKKVSDNGRKSWISKKSLDEVMNATAATTRKNQESYSAKKIVEILEKQNETLTRQLETKDLIIEEQLQTIQKKDILIINMAQSIDATTKVVTSNQELIMNQNKTLLEAQSQPKKRRWFDFK